MTHNPPTEEIARRPVTFSINLAISGRGEVIATINHERDDMVLGVQAPTLDSFLALLKTKIATAQEGGSITHNVPSWEPPWEPPW